MTISFFSASPPGWRARAALGVPAALALMLACTFTPTSTLPAPAADVATGASSGQWRPVPNPVVAPAAFERAVERGTRTRTGEPGANYWQQYARYAIEAELDVATQRLRGRQRAWYINRSPDALAELWLHLHQNLFAPGALRNEIVPLTSGMELTHVGIGGRRLSAAASGAGYLVDGTRLRITLPAPLAAGDSVELDFGWSFTVPPDGAPRSGTTGDTYMIAYWYPQFAVYDDVGGWHTDRYLGNAEFYMGYGDYDVRLTLPAGWIVGATGELVNAANVLTPAARARLDAARRSTGVTHVVREDERGPGRATAGMSGDRVVWHFTARNVRDFAFGASDAYLWDAMPAAIGDRNGDGRPDTVLVHTLYRPQVRQWAWDNAARYAQHSVEFLSTFLWPYAYPHMTVLDGPRSCAGMEYPMLTCIGGPRDTLSLYSVIQHEVAHMWFPMVVGSDEKRYSWQDEGLTRFNQTQAMQDFFPGYDREAVSRNAYLAFARTGGEVELMRHGDLYPLGSSAFGIAAYDKPAVNLLSLRALLGEATFMRAYREYGRRWTNRHPTPWDLFHTFAQLSGRNLDWFWRTWWYETWTLDHAIGEVRREGSELLVTIEDRGDAPMPARVVVTRTGARTERHEIPVEHWLSGARQALLRLSDAGSVQTVELDPDQDFPDIDRANNRWPRR